MIDHFHQRYRSRTKERAQAIDAVRAVAKSDPYVTAVEFIAAEPHPDPDWEWSVLVLISRDYGAQEYEQRRNARAN